MNHGPRVKCRALCAFWEFGLLIVEQNKHCSRLQFHPYRQFYKWLNAKALSVVILGGGKLTVSLLALDVYLVLPRHCHTGLVLTFLPSHWCLKIC